MGTFQGRVEFVHHVSAVQHFVQCDGADVEVSDSDSGGFCLHFAAGSGAVQLCEVLLDAGARCTARDKRLQTPLWWAMARNCVDVCDLVLREDPSVALTVNIDGNSPLHEAAFLGNTRIAQLLLPFYVGFIDVKGREAQTPLHVAARRGSCAIGVLLLKEKASPRAACTYGKTALHHAAERGEAGLELCVYIADIWPCARRLRDASGRTPLALAAERGRLTPTMQALLHPTQGATPRGKASTSLGLSVRRGAHSRQQHARRQQYSRGQCLKPFVGRSHSR